MLTFPKFIHYLHTLVTRHRVIRDYRFYILLYFLTIAGIRLKISKTHSMFTTIKGFLCSRWMIVAPNVISTPNPHLPSSCSQYNSTSTSSYRGGATGVPLRASSEVNAC